VLATVLFTDVVGATERAAALGDRQWRELLDRHHSLVRRELAAFRGKEIDTAGDGFLASFDGPARAIRAAQTISDKVRLMGLDIRAGLHTGECEIIGPKLTGIAVHIGARVAGLAGAGEILVSNTAKDLVAGSGLLFEDRGTHILKGVPGEWRLYAAFSRVRAGHLLASTSSRPDPLLALYFPLRQRVRRSLTHLKRGAHPCLWIERQNQGCDRAAGGRIRRVKLAPLTLSRGKGLNPRPTLG